MCKGNLSSPAVPDYNETAEGLGFQSTALKRVGPDKQWMTDSLCHLIDETETERMEEIRGK